VEIQLEIQPLAPDLGRRAVASGSKKRVIYPSKMTFFSLGTYGKMMINHGMDCGAFFSDTPWHTYINHGNRCESNLKTSADGSFSLTQVYDVYPNLR
jgi:hypothetical protein